MKSQEKLELSEVNILELNSKISLLNSALKFADESDIELFALNYAVEDIYSKLQKIIQIF